MDTARQPNSGPWKPDEYGALVKLLSEIRERPKSLNALMLLRQESDDDVAPAWKRLSADPLYRRLQKNPEFRQFQEGFRQVLKRQRSLTPGPRIEFEFLFWAFIIGYRYYTQKAIRERRKLAARAEGTTRRQGVLAYSNSRKAARSAVRILEREHTNGVRLSNHRDDEKLSSLLKTLAQELDQMPVKKRETDKTAASEAIKFLAFDLATTLRVSSPKVLGLFAAWLGIEIDQTNIAKYSSEAMRKYAPVTRG